MRQGEGARSERGTWDGNLGATLLNARGRVLGAPPLSRVNGHSDARGEHQARKDAHRTETERITDRNGPLDVLRKRWLPCVCAAHVILRVIN